MFVFQVHKAEKQFECPVCPMEFRHKNSLVRHLCQHTGERPYRCQACDSAFISQHRLKEHLRRLHPEQHQQLQAQEHQQQQSPKVKKETAEPKEDIEVVHSKITKTQLQPQQQNTATVLPTLITTAAPPTTVLSLIQATNGQVYLLQQPSTTNHTPAIYLPTASATAAASTSLILTSPTGSASADNYNWIHQHKQPQQAPQISPAGELMASPPKLDIDLRKSPSSSSSRSSPQMSPIVKETDIVATALVASKVLKC